MILEVRRQVFKGSEECAMPPPLMEASKLLKKFKMFLQKISFYYYLSFLPY
jgi:hypothetical protein